jgi:hypothetical protein
MGSECICAAVSDSEMYSRDAVQAVHLKPLQAANTNYMCLTALEELFWITGAAAPVLDSTAGSPL